MAGEKHCDWWDLPCKAADKVVNDGIDAIVSTIQETIGKAFAALGTAWVHIPTPKVTGDGGHKDLDSSTATDADKWNTLVGWVGWVSLIIAALSLIAMFAVWAMERRNGSQPNLLRAGAIITGVMVISTASGIVSAVLPVAAAQQGTGTVAFLQQSTWWIAGGMAVISLMVGGARMAWQQRFDAGRDLARSLLTLIIVAGGGLGIIGTLTTIGDGFSNWILENSTDRDFGANILVLFGTAEALPGGPFGVLVLGTIAVIAAFVQIALMIARGALIVLLAGGLPVAVSFTSMQSGQAFASKYIGWLIAFLAYKPAAAFVYAAAFQLVGTHAYEDDDTGLLQMISGVALMILAVVALPAILRLVVPAAAAVGGGAAMGAALGAAGAAGGKAMELATGAIKKGAAKSTASSGGGASTATAPTGSSSSSTSSTTTRTATSGSTGPSGSAGKPGTDGSAATGGARGAASTAGTTASGAASGGAAAGSGAAGGGAAAASGAAGGGAAAAGAAAGPVGLAAGAAVQTAGKAVKAAHGVAKGAAEDATGEPAK